MSYKAGAFTGSEPGKKLTLGELAAKRPLKVKGEGTFGTTYPNGCHISEVEIDPETGVTEIASYITVDDCGVVVNHAIVEGQMHGAVAQGADRSSRARDLRQGDGAAASRDFQRLHMPRAASCRISKWEHVTASRLNPLASKAWASRAAPHRSGRSV